MPIPAHKVWCKADALYAHVLVSKRMQASREQLLAYYWFTDYTSPLDLIWRWCERHDGHARLFVRAEETEDWSAGASHRAFQGTLPVLFIEAPSDEKFTSHIMGFVARTKQVFSGVPLESRLWRFGWKCSSAEMSALFFVPTIRTTAASFWYFCTAQIPGLPTRTFIPTRAMA